MFYVIHQLIRFLYKRGIYLLAVFSNLTISSNGSVNAIFKVMDCLHIEFPDNMFDLIISRNVVWKNLKLIRKYQSIFVEIKTDRWVNLELLFLLKCRKWYNRKSFYLKKVSPGAHRWEVRGVLLKLLYV